MKFKEYIKENFHYENGPYRKDYRNIVTGSVTEYDKAMFTDSLQASYDRLMDASRWARKYYEDTKDPEIEMLADEIEKMYRDFEIKVEKYFEIVDIK